MFSDHAVAENRAAGPKNAPAPASRASYQPLVILLAAVCVGIVADRFGPLPLAAWWLITLGAWGLWLVCWRSGRLRLAAAAILLATAGLAAAWHHGCWYLFPANDLGQFAQAKTEPVCLEARALKTPRPEPAAALNPMAVVRPGERLRMEVDLLALRDGARWRAVSGKAHLSVEGLLPGIEAGDRLRVFAKLVAPPPPHNPGEFDTAGQLRAERVRSELRAGYSESVTLLERGHCWSLTRWLEKVRIGGNRIFAKYLSPARSALAAAVLLGGREQLQPDRIEPFVETGTIHLLVIAGLHLGILAGGLLFLVRRLPI